MVLATALSGWDTALLIVPAIGLTVLAMFGLDERLATARDNPRHRSRGFCELSPDGTILVLDPDGRPTERGI